MKRIVAKSLMALGLAALVSTHSFGNPTGGSIAAGSASITTVPGTVTINQASNLAIINWQTFSIASGETTKFVQPSAASAALNRVLGGGTSTIDGSLQANGQVILINGNGIVVGSGGMVNTNSFIASTRDIADDDFLSGTLHFTGGNANGVVNSGSITASGGDVYLIGKTVDNEGTISTPNGTAGLAAGDDVLLTQSGLQHVFVSPSATASSDTGATAVKNGGTISGAQAELAAANGNLYALAINNAGTVRANSVTQVGGHVYLTTDSGQVQNNGTISAKQAGNGGEIQFTGGSVWNRGKLDVSGARGGFVEATCDNIEDDGSITTQGMTGYGGNVTITYSGNALGSVSGTIDASGWLGGGSVDFLGVGASSEAYLSLNIQANGLHDTGGRIVVDSPSVYLAGATLNASGPSGSGVIYLGVPDPLYTAYDTIVAQTLYIGLGTTMNVNATVYGNGGTIIAEGTGSAENFGRATANPHGGPGYHAGTINVPPTPVAPPVVATTVASGTATGGGAGAQSGAPFQFVDPDPGVNNAFGRPNTGLFNLTSNTTLVTSPGDSFSAAGAGAAYLFNDTTGALLSTIRGTTAGDAVGSAVQLLTGNTFAVETPNWNDGTGAITFGNGVHGFANGGGNISATNSLVGSASGDEVGSGGMTKLFNGNYVVLSPDWNQNAGAVTLVKPAVGITGLVSAGNSLVGAAGGDRIGSGGVVQLNNGANFVVLSPHFGGGDGAITNGSDTTGVIGVVSADNSLVGASPTDGVGSAGSIVDTDYGYYLALTPNFAGGAGAVTYNSSQGGTTGVISSDNSLVGSASGDHVGSGGITVLQDNHGYVVASPDWNNGAGAVTVGNNAVGISGEVGDGNSLVGASAGDHVGSGGIDPIVGTGGFLVFTPQYNNDAGAVTMISDAHGLASVISGANSFLGAQAGDQIGSGGYSVLANSNVVVLSPQFDNGAGAATWIASPDVGITNATGVVSQANSLVGQQAGDHVGSGGVIQLSNGNNYLVLSPDWGGGKGAITNGDGNQGAGGVVGAGNSLVGAYTGDHVGAAGSVTDPFNGLYYLVTTSNFHGGAGAVTWNNMLGGATGPISATNSLIGSSSTDHVGSGGITILSDNYPGDYVVSSPDWNGGTGAVTWGAGFGGVAGTISQANSLVGAQAGDHVGSGGVLQSGSTYLVLSPEWTSGAGAVTEGESATGIAGLVSGANSLVGWASGDHVGSGGATASGGDWIVLSPDWNNERGAVTVLGNSVTGAVSSANSLVGAAGGDMIGSGGLTALPSGDFLVASPDFNSFAGAITWLNPQSAPTGVVSAANSLVGAQGGDSLGSGGIVLLNNNANYVVLSPGFNGGAGAVTNGSDTAVIKGVLGAANSLVGSSSTDGVGSAGSIQDTAYGYYLVDTAGFGGGAGAVTYNREAGGTVGVVAAGNSLIGSGSGDGIGSAGTLILTGNHGYVVSSPNWNGGMGAITFGSAAYGVSGYVGATNSLVGAASGDNVGSGGILTLANGNYLVLSPNFNGDAGAVTFVGGTGRRGVVGSDNSLVGANPGDAIGDGGIATLANGNYLVLSPDFNGGVGAVTFGSAASGVAGIVSAANSLVGVSAGDHIGGGGIIFLSNGNYLVQSPDFAGNSGAVTWGSAAAGITGTVTSANSIVGAMPDDGEEFAGESANGDVYFIAFTTDTTGGGDGRVVVGSTAGFAPESAQTDFFLLAQVNTVESSGFNFNTEVPVDPVVDLDAPAHGTTSTDPFSETAINSGHGGHNIASGSSTEFSNAHQRLVLPGNGVWNIFDGVVHSAPPPQWISNELQLNLSPAVYAHLNDILFGSSH